MCCIANLFLFSLFFILFSSSHFSANFPLIDDVVKNREVMKPLIDQYLHFLSWNALSLSMHNESHFVLVHQVKFFNFCNSFLKKLHNYLPKKHRHEEKKLWKCSNDFKTEWSEWKKAKKKRIGKLKRKRVTST